MPTDKASPRYNQAVVELALFELAIRMHPQRLKVDELAKGIVWDPDDTREVDTAIVAIRGLREAGLFSYEDGDRLVSPTPAALHAHMLFLMR